MTLEWKRPIFIVGIHKSGTSLMRALLDGHPDLAVLPREPHFFERSGLPVRYPLRPSDGGIRTQDAIRRRTVRALENEAKDDNPYSDSPSFQGYSPSLFERSWNPQSEHMREMYKDYVESLFSAWKSVPQGRRPVDKSTEYLEFVPLLANWFSDARFLHVVRNPYAVMASWRRYRQRRTRRYPSLRAVAEALGALGPTVESYHELLGPTRYRVVRFEELTKDPSAVMYKSADFLGIPWDESLIQPTLGGLPWRGNSSRDERYEGVSRRAAARQLNDVKVIERRIVNLYAPTSFRILGYEYRGAARIAWILPVRGERPKTYVTNRCAAS